MKMAALYESVTNNIIRDLQQGAIPWTKPWKTKAVGTIMPGNIVTGRSYHGINIPILWAAAIEKGYPSHHWLTFKQAQENGATVRQGEKSTHIVFVKRLRIGEEEDQRQTSMMKAFSIFNVAQVDGLTEAPIVEVPEVERLNNVETFITATKADIHFGGDMAAYVPSRDFITMPPVHSFKGMEHYYATALHELGHWTGARWRLNRDLSGRFKTQAYAAEELVAELNAAFLCARLGIEGELRHSGYIESWIKLLKNDEKAIFTAASKASEAADYLHAFSA